MKTINWQRVSFALSIAFQVWALGSSALAAQWAVMSLSATAFFVTVSGQYLLLLASVWLEEKCDAATAERHVHELMLERLKRMPDLHIEFDIEQYGPKH